MLSLRAGLALESIEMCFRQRVRVAFRALSGNFLPEGARALVWRLGKVA